jgi:hypothetical protein
VRPNEALQLTREERRHLAARQHPRTFECRAPVGARSLPTALDTGTQEEEMRLPTRLLAFLALASAPHLQAQVPAGYYVGHAPLLPDSLHEAYLSDRFTISIVRLARDSVERELLARAESLMPPADSIERKAALVSGSGHVAAFKEAKEMPGDRWWWRDWDDVLLPYALTGAAIDHYVARVRALAAAPNPFARWNQGVAHRARIEYTAAVEPRGADGGHRVRMQVRFSFYCGPLCALSFDHSRIVEFDPAGTPVRVEGDRPPSYVVS